MRGRPAAGWRSANHLNSAGTIHGGVLYAEAVEVSLNPKLATYTVELRDEEQVLIALFRGTVYRKSRPSDGGTESRSFG